MRIDTFYNYFQNWLATAHSFLVWYIGNFDGLIYTVITLCIAEYVTSLMCSLVIKEYSRETGVICIIQKMYIFMFIGIGHLLDIYLLTGGSTLRNSLIFWYIGNEGINLIEKAILLDVPVPKILKNILTLIWNKSECQLDKKIENKEDQ